MTIDKTPAEDTQGLTRDEVMDAVCRLGSQQAAADALGVTRRTIYNWVHAFPERVRKPRTPKVKKPAPQPTPEKPRVRVKAGTVRLEGLLPAQPTGPMGPIVRPMWGTRNARGPNIVLPVSDELVSTCFVGDLHAHPSMEDECARVLRLVGEHIRATKPRVVVLGGDFSDWSSVCHHERNQTWRGRSKPTVREDIECVRRLVAVLKPYLSDVEHCVFTWGNHEDWLCAFENEHPETHGDFTSEVSSIFEKAGFVQYRYGEYAHIAGVAYTHVPKNKMDRPVGGQTAENTVAMQSTHDVVFCHSHVTAMGKRAKFGYRSAITVLNGGSAMPLDYVGEYAQRTTGSYVDSGVLDIDAADGRIVGHAFRDMRRLEALHGDAVDATIEGRA